MNIQTAKKLAQANGCRFFYLTGSSQGKPFWCLQRDDLLGHVEDIYPAELRDMSKDGFLRLIEIVNDISPEAQLHGGFVA